eukprot:IDg12004t1
MSTISPVAKVWGPCRASSAMVKVRLSVTFVFLSRQVGSECACYGDASMALRQAFIDLGPAGASSYYDVALCVQQKSVQIAHIRTVVLRDSAVLPNQMKRSALGNCSRAHCRN